MMKRIRETIKKCKEDAINNLRYYVQQKQFGIKAPAGEPTVDEKVNYWRGVFDAWDKADHLFRETYHEKMTVDDVSAETGYSRQVIYQKVKNGEIPGVTKVRGRLLFDAEDAFVWAAYNFNPNKSKSKRKTK